MTDPDREDVIFVFTATSKTRLVFESISSEVGMRRWVREQESKNNKK